MNKKKKKGVESSLGEGKKTPNYHQTNPNASAKPEKKVHIKENKNMKRFIRMSRKEKGCWAFGNCDGIYEGNNEGDCP